VFALAEVGALFLDFVNTLILKTRHAYRVFPITFAVLIGIIFDPW